MSAWRGCTFFSFLFFITFEFKQRNIISGTLTMSVVVLSSDDNAITKKGGGGGNQSETRNRKCSHPDAGGAM